MNDFDDQLMADRRVIPLNGDCEWSAVSNMSNVMETPE